MRFYKYFASGDYDENEARDTFKLDNKVIPKHPALTKLPGNPPPPVRIWASDGKSKYFPVKTHKNAKYLPAEMHSNKKNTHKHSEKTKQSKLSINDAIKFLNKNSKAVFIITATSLILGGVILLLISILMPQAINIAFAPALNIIKTQVICGFVIFAGLLIGATQLLNTDESDLQNSHNKHDGVSLYDCSI